MIRPITKACGYLAIALITGRMTLQHPRIQRSGFTLIELLMVVTIIGIMALLVMPRIRIDNGAVDTAVRTVSMSVMVAQREAVSRQHNVLVQFDTAGHSVRTIWDANNNNAEDAGEKSRPFLMSERVVLGRPAGVPALGGTGESVPTRLATPRGPYFVLQRSGSADRSDVIYFSTAKAMAGGADIDVRAMAISRATGRTVWYKWAKTAWRRG